MKCLLIYNQKSGKQNVVKNIDHIVSMLKEKYDTVDKKASFYDGETRDVLEVYEMNFLNGIVFMCAGLSMVFYSLWSISQRSNLVYTVPIVLFIVIRYLLLVFMGRSEADPTALILSDKTLWVSCGLCALIMLGMLYL